jgi:hypothetical protein
MELGTRKSYHKALKGAEKRERENGMPKGEKSGEVVEVKKGNWLERDEAEGRGLSL